MVSFLCWRPDRDGYNNTLRGTIRVTKDLKFHASDLVLAVHGTDSRRYAGSIIQRLIDSNSFSKSDITYIDRGTMKTQLVSFKNAIKLVMVLPGKNAKDGRANFAQVLLQFIAGDAQLKSDIDKNAESNDLLNILAREALQIETSETASSNNQNGNVPSAAASVGEKNLVCSTLSPLPRQLRSLSFSKAGGHLNTHPIPFPIRGACAEHEFSHASSGSSHRARSQQADAGALFASRDTVKSAAAGRA
jgi:hypothetical protein